MNSEPIALLVALTLGLKALPSAIGSEPEAANGGFIGTWMIETVNEEPIDPSDDGTREILILNDTHFIYGRMYVESKKLALVKKGGSYKIEDGRYSETMEFAPSGRTLGETYSFDIEVRDDKLIKSGSFRSRRLDQIWKRVSLAVEETANTGSGSESNWAAIDVKDLAGWRDADRWWSEQNGVIVAESDGGDRLPKWHYLIWDGSLEGNFELRLEYRIAADSPQDAGVCFRVDRAAGVGAKGNLSGYQAELDTANLYSRERFIRQGKLFGNIHDGKRTRMYKRGERVEIDRDGEMTTTPLSKKFVPAKVFRKPPEWNECRVRVNGETVQLFLNGQLANEVVDKDPEGRSTGDGLALQFRPVNKYRFEVRNLEHRSLSE